MWPFGKIDIASWLGGKKQSISMNPAVAHDTEALRARLSKNERYQWVKSELAGTVVRYSDVLADGDGAWLIFGDGSRVNVDLIGDYVIPLEGGEALDLSLDEPAKARIRGVQAAKPAAQSPVQALLVKQKPNLIVMDIGVNLNLPTPQLYKLLSESFDNVEDEVIDFVMTSVNVEAIQGAVRDAVREFYKSQAK